MILLRHLPVPGGDGLCYGRLDLPPGPEVATGAGILHAELPFVAAIASSPRARCLALAEAIGTLRGLAPETDADLAEIDFGRWEGLPWNSVPRAELDAWAADLRFARPHGGESVAMLENRVARALARSRARPGPVLLVTHGGVARAARALAGEPEPWTRRLAPGAWLTLP